MITDEELKEIELRCSEAQNGPWKAYIENRDHESGNSFIMTGEGVNRGEDIEALGATNADFDFIANARQDIPRLIKEIRLLKKIVRQTN
jgi:hypothetical protein